MKPKLLALLALLSTADAATITGISNDWQEPFFFQIEAGSNVIQNSFPGGGLNPLFYTMHVPAGLEITRLNVLSYKQDGDFSQNGGSLLALQIGSTLEASPETIEADFSILINHILFSDQLIERDNLLETLSVGEQLNGAPTLVSRDYALFLNETSTAVSNIRFELEFIASPIPEPTATALLALLPFFLTRRRPTP